VSDCSLRSLSVQTSTDRLAVHELVMQCNMLMGNMLSVTWAVCSARSRSIQSSPGNCTVSPLLTAGPDWASVLGV
jgi:hypothetical protein